MHASHIRSMIFSSAILLSTSATSMAQHDGDIEVGRTAANQLNIGGFDVANEIVILIPAGEEPEFWTNNEPGFEAVLVDEPNENLFTLEPGCQIRLELVSCDPAFAAVGDTVIDEPGEQVALGDQSLHTHITWVVDSILPGFDPLKVLWQATFKLVDTGSTNYADSEPFTIYFAIVSCTRGDCNADTLIDTHDIQSFIEIVLNPPAATDAQRCTADVDRDGLASINDIGPFVDLLMSQ